MHITISEPALAACDGAQQASAPPVRLNGAKLLERAFDLDLEHGRNCGGGLKIIAAKPELPVIDDHEARRSALP